METSVKTFPLLIYCIYIQTIKHLLQVNDLTSCYFPDRVKIFIRMRSLNLDPDVQNKLAQAVNSHC